jgi:hypothetical protein
MHETTAEHTPGLTLARRLAQQLNALGLLAVDDIDLFARQLAAGELKESHWRQLLNPNPSGDAAKA